MSALKEPSHPNMLTWYAVGGAIIVLGISVAIALAIYWSYQRSSPVPPPPIAGPTSVYTLRRDPMSDQSNYGSWPMVRAQVQPHTAETCEDDPRRMLLSSGECRCRYPFYGPDCAHEAHDEKYHALGTLNRISGEALSVGSLSECSQSCDATEGCHGFEYTPGSESASGMCVLLTEPIPFAPHELTYYRHTQAPTLYAKDLTMFRPINRIYLARGPAFFPPRFWMEPQVPGFAALHRGHVHTITFCPMFVHMDQAYTGIYSRHPFRAEHQEHMHTQGSTPHTYIHHAGTPLELRAHWKLDQTLYVMYY